MDLEAKESHESMPVTVGGHSGEYVRVVAFDENGLGGIGCWSVFEKIEVDIRGRKVVFPVMPHRVASHVAENDDLRTMNLRGVKPLEDSFTGALAFNLNAAVGRYISTLDPAPRLAEG